MSKRLELIKKSLSAAILIAFGDFALLKLGNPIGPFIFAFGLLGVCYMNLSLFTGKCGFFIQDKIKFKDLLLILIFNLIGGYVMGLLFSVIDPLVVKNAISKVSSWDVSLEFFIKSMFCGFIMYIAVYMYKKGTPLGIIFGIPLFILCGFQHCIANIITLGVARSIDLSILICIVGNFVGSIIMWYLSKDIEIVSNKKRK